MKVVIHAGMPKTGSSSIQEHLYTTNYPGLLYVPWTSSSHNALFVLLFQEVSKLSRFYAFHAKGAEFCSRLPKMRRRELAALRKTMQGNSAEILVFSAEAISSPALAGAAAKMISFFRQWSDDITFISYIRPPRSWAVSAFQQNLKGPQCKDLNIGKLWPQYRERFASFGHLSMLNRVVLKPYIRDQLVGGDVVEDFVDFLGLKTETQLLANVNPTLSAEAVALLYVQRRLGSGFIPGFPWAQQGNRKFVEVLQTIGSRKLGFADSLWNPVLAANSADLDWIEVRLGQHLHDAPSPDALEIASEQDLFDLAIASEDDLLSVVPEALHSRDPDPLPRVTATLNALQEKCFQLVKLRKLKSHLKMAR